MAEDLQDSKIRFKESVPLSATIQNLRFLWQKREVFCYFKFLLRISEPNWPWLTISLSDIRQTVHPPRQG